MIGACFSLCSLGLIARLPEFGSPRSNHCLIKNELKLELTMDAAILLMCIKDLTCVTFSCICGEKNQNPGVRVFASVSG